MDKTTKQKLEKLIRVISYLSSMKTGEIVSNTYPGFKITRWKKMARKLFIYIAKELGISVDDIAEFLGISFASTRLVREIARIRLAPRMNVFIRKTIAILNSQIVYIAGPVTGLPYSEVLEVFAKAEKKLKTFGYIPINPIRIVPPTADWSFAMRILIQYLSYCDKLCLLPGWEQSKGVRLELEIAKQLGLEIIYLNGDKNALGLSERYC